MCGSRFSMWRAHMPFPFPKMNAFYFQENRKQFHQILYTPINFDNNNKQKLQ